MDKNSQTTTVFNSSASDEYEADRTTLVVDIGSFTIKYSLFGLFDDKLYLLKTSIKDSSNIIGDGKLNFNLLKRDLERKIETFSEICYINRVIIIPPNSTCQFKVVPNFEYKEKKAEFNKSVKDEYLDIKSKSYTYDWMKTDDIPEKDVQFIVIDSMPEDIIFDMNSILVNLPVDEYLIASPLTGFLRINNTEEPLMIIDFGHRGTKIVIVENGNIISADDAGTGGYDLTMSMTSGGSHSVEKIKLKHNTSIEELPRTTTHVFDNLNKAMNESKKRFDSKSKTPVTKYVVIGGGASIELEKEINLESVGMERVYFDLGIENGRKLPFEVKNYVALSKSTIDYLDEVYGDHSKYIDLSAPKQSLGLKIKEISRMFESMKKPLYASVACVVLSAILIGEGSKSAIAHKTEVQGINNGYQSTLNSLQNTNTSLNSEYQNILTSVPQDTGNQHDTGLMLRRLQEITPPKFNIQTFELNGDGNSGNIVVKSESQVMVSTFLTLLQDSSSGIFNRANIVDIKIVESMGSKYYVTTIFVEGRTL